MRNREHPVGGVGAWSSDGVILFPAQRIIYRVDAGGGDCLPVTDTLGQIQTHPRFLPDGRRFIFSNPYQSPTTYVADLESGDFEPLLVGATSPLFVSPDWLLYAPPPDSWAPGRSWPNASIRARSI